jgi:dephospho-CoA kinase
MAGFRIGLTGGVGSGKSTVATMLESFGAGLVDADALVHELIGPGGAAVAAVRAEFGSDAIATNGSVDRTWMRTRVFTDPNARRRLEDVLHPRVRTESQARADALADSVPYVVLMIPLLVESGGWSRRAQRVLVVDCTETTQIERVCRRPGMTRATALGILAAQATRATRLAAADDVLFNELPLDDLRDRVEQLHRQYLRCAN